MPARSLGGLFGPSAVALALAAARPVIRQGASGQLAVSVLLTLILAGGVAWFVDSRVTELLLAQLVERATDQVELAVLPRMTLADFEPPYTPAKLDALNAQLDPILDRARESRSGIIRVNVFARDGTVLYSDVASLRGQVVSPLSDQLLAAALSGSAGAQITHLAQQETADLDPRYGTAMEAYVPCILDGRVAGAYEFYVESGPLWPMRWTIWSSIGLAFSLLLCGVVMLLPPTVRPAAAHGSRADAATGPLPVIRTGLIRLQPGGKPAGGKPAAECWLSRREMEVLRLLATNRTYREIAGELSLSEETIRSHVKSILHKLGQHDRVRAVDAAVKAGILR